MNTQLPQMHHILLGRWCPNSSLLGDNVAFLLQLTLMPIKATQFTNILKKCKDSHIYTAKAIHFYLNHKPINIIQEIVELLAPVQRKIPI